MNRDEPKVLVVDDELQIREMLELNLSLRGFAVRSARDGTEALSLIRDWHPEAIILDVVMPKIDGFSLLPIIRRLTQAPVIMLTAKSELVDVVRGLESGADGYIPKPFEVAELVARLNTALRRPELDRRESLSYEGLQVDLKTYEVKRGDRKIDLSAREFNVLVTIMRHPGQVFTRDQLFDAVWGPQSEADRGIVDRTISNLRAKVDHEPEVKLIQTIRGVGYTLRK